MALGPFVEYYPDNSQTEEFLKYGAPAVVTPLPVASNTDVCVFNSHGARAVVVELVAETGLGVQATVGLRLSYLPDPADAMAMAAPTPAVIQSFGPPLEHSILGAAATPADLHLAQPAKKDTVGVTDYHHNFRYATVYSGNKVFVPMDILAIPSDQRIVLQVRPTDFQVASLRVRLAFSDEPLACDIPVVDYAEHDRVITEIPTGYRLAYFENHAVAPGATIGTDLGTGGIYSSPYVPGHESVNVYVRTTQASAVNGLAVTYWLYGTEVHTEQFTLPAGNWQRAFPRIGGYLPSRVAFTNGAIQNSVHVYVGTSLVGAATPECLIRCPPRGATPRGEPTATVIDADRVGLDTNAPGVVAAVNTVNATLVAGITVTTGGTASAPTTGKTTALTTDNSTAIATVQVGKRYRVTIIGGEGTCFVNGATAARATDEVWYDKQKFEFIAVATATAAQKYTAGTANSTVNVTPLDGGTIA